MIVGTAGFGGGPNRGGSVVVGGICSNFVPIGSAADTDGWTGTVVDGGSGFIDGATTNGPGFRVVGIAAYDGGSEPAGVRSGFITGTGNAPGVAPVTVYQFADAFGYCPVGAYGFAPGVTEPYPYHRYAGGPA
jgi:hypothetical protein